MKDAIQTKILPHTNRRPQRIKAFTTAESVTLTTETLDYQNHVHLHYLAAKALQDKLKMSGSLIVGNVAGSGYVFVFVPDEIVSALQSARLTIQALVEDLRDAEAWNVDGGEQLYNTQETDLALNEAIKLLQKKGDK